MVAHQSEAAREQLPARRAIGANDSKYAPHEHMPQVSLVRRLLGYDAIAKMDFSQVIPAEKQAELRAWFPEAEFHWAEPDYLETELEKVLGPRPTRPTGPDSPVPPADRP